MSDSKHDRRVALVALARAWFDAVHSTVPLSAAQRQRVIDGIAYLYEMLGLPAPRFVWVDSPLAAELTASTCARALDEEHRAGYDRRQRAAARSDRWRVICAEALSQARDAHKARLPAQITLALITAVCGFFACPALISGLMQLIEARGLSVVGCVYAIYFSAFFVSSLVGGSMDDRFRVQVTISLSGTLTFGSVFATAWLLDVPLKVARGAPMEWRIGCAVGAGALGLLTLLLSRPIWLLLVWRSAAHVIQRRPVEDDTAARLDAFLTEMLSQLRSTAWSSLQAERPHGATADMLSLEHHVQGKMRERYAQLTAAGGRAAHPGDKQVLADIQRAKQQLLARDRVVALQPQLDARDLAATQRYPVKPIWGGLSPLGPAEWAWCAERASRISKQDARIIAAFLDTTLASVWYPHRAFVVICDRPRVLQRERDGIGVQLHNSSGPSVAWAGFALYHSHGWTMPSHLYERIWTAQQISSETDLRSKQALIERMGWPQFIAAAKLPLVARAPDPGNPGRQLSIYEAPSGFTHGFRLLVGHNGSPDSVGDVALFAEPVPAHMTDPLAAAAWQYDCPVETYAQLARRT